jgi:hypothetical protein
MNRQAVLSTFAWQSYFLRIIGAADRRLALLQQERSSEGAPPEPGAYDVGRLMNSQHIVLDLSYKILATLHRHAMLSGYAHAIPDALPASGSGGPIFNTCTEGVEVGGSLGCLLLHETLCFLGHESASGRVSGLEVGARLLSAVLGELHADMADVGFRRRQGSVTGDEEAPDRARRRRQELEGLEAYLAQHVWPMVALVVRFLLNPPTEQHPLAASKGDEAQGGGRGRDAELARARMSKMVAAALAEGVGSGGGGEEGAVGVVTSWGDVAVRCLLHPCLWELVKQVLRLVGTTPDGFAWTLDRTGR